MAELASEASASYEPQRLMKYPLGMVSSQDGPALESKLIKIQHIFAVLVTTLVSSYLLWTRDKLYSGPFVTFVKSNRSSVQIIVQLLSHALALLQLYGLRSIINFGSRLKLQQHQVSLNKLRLWAALSNAQIDWSLPAMYLSSAAIASACLMVPGSIWAGALSPITTLSFSIDGTVEVPAYSAHSAGVWDIEFQTHIQGEDVQLWNKLASCHPLVYDHRGFVPACPVPALQGSLLLSASSATSADGSERLHSKIDNSQWTYTGRSYGVGSSVALTQLELPQRISSSAMQMYTYYESGYMPKVNCIKNFTSSIAFSRVGQLPDGDTIVLYLLTGSLPNEAPGTGELYPVTTMFTNYENMLAWAARSLNGRNMIAIASGLQNYTVLNQTQCEVIFVPTTFEVSVNSTTRSIAVQATDLKASDIEKSGHLAANTIDSVNFLSRMSNSLYNSILGISLQQNVMNKQLQLNVSSSEITDQIVATAMEDSFAAVIDDILVAYGASQIIISGDTTSTVVVAKVNAARIGEPMYQYATFGINAIFVFAVVFEAIRTRFWRGLLQLDYTNITSVIVSASAGGYGLARTVSELCKQNGGRTWRGNSECSAFSEVKVGFVASTGVPGMPAIGTQSNILDENEGVASYLIRRKPVPSPFLEDTSRFAE